MRLVVHDYSGHPGQVQLSRGLASRGHTVEHQYCPDYTTGRGRLRADAADPAGFSVRPVRMSAPFARYSAATRARQEVQYASAATRAVVQAEPDVVLLSNVPLLSHALLARRLDRHGVPMVFWHQDVYSAAITDAAVQRIPVAGVMVGALARRLEAGVARRSRGVVAITEAFLPVYTAWGVERDRVEVIENWGPVDEVTPRSRANPWARRHGLTGRPVALYSGTLGYKHDPSFLVRLAHRFAGRPDGGVVVVVTEGRGREWLSRQVDELGLTNLLLLDFQPYDQLPDVLASADVLLALLDGRASRYSVPSKVLTYLCAGRPVVAGIDGENAAAALLGQSGAGVVFEPGDHVAGTEAVLRLLDDPEDAAERGLLAREYAERHFDLAAVAGRFEASLLRAIR